MRDLLLGVLKLLLQLLNDILRNFELSLKLLELVSHGSWGRGTLTTTIDRSLPDLSLLLSWDDSFIRETVILTRDVTTRTRCAGDLALIVDDSAT